MTLNALRLAVVLGFLAFGAALVHSTVSHAADFGASARAHLAEIDANR